MKAPRALFFDLDSTLVYLDPVALLQRRTLVCNSVARDYALDAATLLTHHRSLTLDLWSFAEEGSETGHAIALRIWQQALSLSGCQAEAAAHAASELYWSNRHGVVRLFDDSRSVLEALRRRFQLAVITNGPLDMQIDKLEVHGCEGHFDLFVASSELGILKPDPRIFAHTCDKLGVAPDDAWHIGDNLLADVAGAKAAGLTAVWLNRTGAMLGEAQPRPDYEITSLTELLPLLSIPA